MDGNPLASDAIRVEPPYSVRLILPASLINGYFLDKNIAIIPLSIKVTLPNKARRLNIFTPKVTSKTFTTKLLLYPKFPLEYKVIEYDAATALLSTTAKTLTGTTYYVQGCDRSGCHTHYNICAYAPTGAIAIAPIGLNVTGPTFFWDNGGYSRVNNGFCADFIQAVHDKDRNVSLNITYIEQDPIAIRRNIHLSPIGEQSAIMVNDLTSANQCTVNKEFTAAHTTNGVYSGPPHLGGPFNNNIWCYLSEQVIMPDVWGGRVAYGHTYVADFDPKEVSYEVVFRSFTGEELSVLPGRADPRVEVTDPSNSVFKRISITPKSLF